MKNNKKDATFIALGGLDGIAKLVDRFYTIMDSDERFAVISEMHREPDAIKREKLTYFLSGWTGGEETYYTHFGRGISMPGAHAHLVIGEAERDMWLSCMYLALRDCEYPDDLVDYMIHALSFPAEVIRRTCERNLPADRSS